VFLKGHFVKKKNVHPTTQLGGTQKDHIQKERPIRQVLGVGIDTQSLMKSAAAAESASAADFCNKSATIGVLDAKPLLLRSF